ncbi:hypothetical protein M911_07920 [Ectothiorhodospira haloalkaliphila]|uniref:Uncharacterized protein n=1 Tax=Ectothiorhodospira haloalkaliphila TaxID=421628 RepID=W8KUL2_9GAMM|nr:hypothetical protein M911_07920 [Ectothiorhodospira haloalkaliphila]
MTAHVGLEVLGPEFGCIECVQVLPQVAMQITQTIEHERCWMLLVGEAAQDHGRQVAAVDGQAGAGRQAGGRGRVVIHTELGSLSGIPRVVTVRLLCFKVFKNSDLIV